MKRIPSFGTLVIIVVALGHSSVHISSAQNSDSSDVLLQIDLLKIESQHLREVVSELDQRMDGLQTQLPASTLVNRRTERPVSEATVGDSGKSPIAILKRDSDNLNRHVLRLRQRMAELRRRVQSVSPVRPLSQRPPLNIDLTKATVPPSTTLESDTQAVERELDIFIRQVDVFSAKVASLPTVASPEQG